jgi:hypothetical protein
MSKNEDYFEEIGIGEGDEKIGDKTESYKANKKEKHRVSLALWDGYDGDDFGVDNLDQPTPKFLVAKRVYVEGAGYVIVTSPEILKVAGKEPRKCVGTVIVKWPTNPDGTINTDMFKAGKYQVLPWVFGPDKYQKITSQQSASGWPLGKHDLTVFMTSGKDEKYQDFEVNVTNDNLFRKLLGNPKAKPMIDQLMGKIQACVPELKKVMGRILTPDELREKMGRSGGGGGSSDGPVDSAGMSSGEDVDSMLDEMDV